MKILSCFEEIGYENMEKNRERTESKIWGQNQVLRLAGSEKALVESVRGSSCDTVREVDNQVISRCLSYITESQ